MNTNGFITGNLRGSDPAPMTKTAHVTVAALCNILLYMRHVRATAAFVLELRYLPNIALPRTYNEKMFWRRAFDTNPDFAVFCNKLETKTLAQRCGERIQTVPTLWFGTDPAAFPDELWREGIIVKMINASSRSLVIKGKDDCREAFLNTCKRWLSRPYKIWNAEWGYTQVAPALLAEPELKPTSGTLDELKVHACDGEVFYTTVYQHEKTPAAKSGLYDYQGNRLGATTSLVVRNPARALPDTYRLPQCYDAAMRAARDLSKGYDYLRIDFMCSGNDLYLGEITVYPTGGLLTTSDPDHLQTLSDMWDLRKSWFMRHRHTGWRHWYQSMLTRHLDWKDETK